MKKELKIEKKCLYHTSRDTKGYSTLIYCKYILNILNVLHSQPYHVYICVYVHVHIYLYKVAKTHRMPYLDRLFSATKPCN